MATGNKEMGGRKHTSDLGNYFVLSLVMREFIVLTPWSPLKIYERAMAALGRHWCGDL